MPTRFNRKKTVLALTGYKTSTLHEAMIAGTFPPPDGYLGERSPFWTDETLEAWQRSMLKAGATPGKSATAAATAAHVQRRAEMKAKGAPRKARAASLHPTT